MSDTTSTSRRAARRRHPLAFTLLELIVVIVILGILALLAIPTFQAVITRAEDSNTQGTLASLVREASALAAFRGETTFTVADFDDALADLPAAAVGVMAQGWTLDSEPGGSSSDEFTVSLALGGSPIGSAAGLALTSSTGNCAMVRTDGVGSGVQGWIVDGAGGGAGCSGLVALDGPGAEAPAPTTTTSTTTTTPPPPAATLVASTGAGWGSQSGRATGDDTAALGELVGLDPAEVVKVDSGNQHSCALLSTGSVACWGTSWPGALGTGTSVEATPVAVTGLTDVVDIAVGYAHSCAATASGAVFCWGDNWYGTLGDGTNDSATTPVQVLGVGGSGTLSGVTALASGRDHTCAVASGSVFCWGLNAWGELGDGNSDSGGYSVTSNTPVQVLGVGGSGSLGSIVAVAAGDQFSCALTVAGAGYCWGNNAVGQLGDGSTTPSATPVQVSGLSGASSLSATHQHACVVAAGGASCWGQNMNGQLGDGTTDSASSPVQVVGVGGSGTLSGVTSVSAGQGYSCAVASGSVFCWGQNGTGFGSDGTFGDASTSNSATPVQMLGLGGVGPLAGAQAVFAGYFATFVVAAP